MTATDWRPTATVEAIRERARLLQRIRAFFMERAVLEVETPQLSQAGNTDPQIESFSVSDPCSGEPAGWLHTSPEFLMKRLLASGIGDCYQIARVFRAGESGRFHNPEFSMLEWYRLGFDTASLMDEVESLLHHCVAELPEAQRLAYGDLFQACYGLNPHEVDRETLRDVLDQRGELPEGMASAGLSDLLSVAFSIGVEPQLPAVAFVTDFPACQASLARLKGDGPEVADRFELYVNGVELANGFHELADVGEQTERFRRELISRQENGAPTISMDQRFLDALASGLPDCSGVALGVDRLLMLKLGARRLDEVICFPADRA